MTSSNQICQAWFLSTRPKTLFLSLAPFFLGALMAYVVYGTFNGWLLFCASMAAVCIQIATNLINDAYDDKNGADLERIGPKRGLHLGSLSAKEILWGGYFCLGMAFIFGIPLILFGGWPIALILLISMACAFLYTGGPMPLAYYGLGEVFVIVFFGVVSTVSGYFFQSGVVDKIAIWAGIQLGLLATLPIAINNLRDREGDAKVNKRTLAVRFGDSFARYEITFLLGLPFIIGIVWFFSYYPFVGILPLALLPQAYAIFSGIWHHEAGIILNRYLGFSILLYMCFFLCMCLGFLL